MRIRGMIGVMIRCKCESIRDDVWRQCIKCEAIYWPAPDNTIFRTLRQQIVLNLTDEIKC